MIMDYSAILSNSVHFIQLFQKIYWELIAFLITISIVQYIMEINATKFMKDLYAKFNLILMNQLIVLLMMVRIAIT